MVLFENERMEWEPPGGKPEFGESPEESVGTEILEELSLEVEAGPLVEAFVH